MDESLLMNIKNGPKVGRDFRCRLVYKSRICLNPSSYLKVWLLEFYEVLTLVQEEVLLLRVLEFIVCIFLRLNYAVVLNKIGAHRDWHHAQHILIHLPSRLNLTSLPHVETRFVALLIGRCKKFIDMLAAILAWTILLSALLDETINHGLTAATSHNTVTSLFMQDLLCQGKVTNFCGVARRDLVLVEVTNGTGRDAVLRAFGLLLHIHTVDCQGGLLLLQLMQRVSHQVRSQLIPLVGCRGRSSCRYTVDRVR